MKIAIASLGDPRSVKTWSGIPAYIIPALEKRGHQVVGIALDKPAEPWYYNWLRRYYYRFQKKWFMSSVEKTVLQAIGRQFDAEVARIQPDVVLSIHADFLAYTTFKQPAVSIHDTTFATLVGYYGDFCNLTERSIKAGNDMYGKALDRTAAAVFSADWASQSALSDYHMPASKVFTIPLGANITYVPKPDEVDSWIDKRVADNNCNLLFLGIAWERKGGPDALRMVAHLNKLGVKSTLTIVGSTPKISAEFEPFVNNVGFLRKNVPAEAAKFDELLKTSTALILPSLAECYGCVFCEANAYGLPSLGRNTGGIPEIIKEGVNGFMLGQSESAEAFAERWAEVWQDKEQYRLLSKTSRKEFETRLNYDVFAEKLEEVIRNI
ncbi:glycosyltransferase family 4 protein [Mucilaginibacter lacusdianchii]|uniref:glycosyltransferase family 4 protein n=1 Tax=Mucilaginibacter lacusdianchii TaxID=2684211 RepID=UPI00131B23C5|nr:glycosyltransferase family 4 protein [Mucilaginibacter sp. JXJ CY 39]